MADQIDIDEACVTEILTVWDAEIDRLEDRIASALAEIHGDWRAQDAPLLTPSHWAYRVALRVGKARAALEEMQRVWAHHREGKFTVVRAQRPKSRAQVNLDILREQGTHET